MVLELRITAMNKAYVVALIAALCLLATASLYAAEISTEQLLGEMGITAGQTIPSQQAVGAVGIVQKDRQITSAAVNQDIYQPRERTPIILDVVKENPSAVKNIEYGEAPVTVAASKVSNIISVPYDIESVSSSKFCPEKTTSPSCINPDHIGRSTRQLIFPGVLGKDTDVVIVTSQKTYALSLQPYATTPVHIQITNKGIGKRGNARAMEYPKNFPVVEKLYETIIAALRDEQVEGYVASRPAKTAVHDTPELLFVLDKVLEGEMWRIAFIDVVNKSKEQDVSVKENYDEVQTAIAKLVGIPLIASLSRELLQAQNQKTIENGGYIARLVVVAESSFGGKP